MYKTVLVVKDISPVIQIMFGQKKSDLIFFNSNKYYSIVPMITISLLNINSKMDG